MHVNPYTKEEMIFPLEMSAHSSMLLSNSLMSQAIILLTVMSAHQD